MLAGGNRSFGSLQARRSGSAVAPWAIVAVSCVCAAISTAGGADGADLNPSSEHIALARIAADTPDGDSISVRIPVNITLRRPEGRRLGLKLRLPVHFSANRIRLVDIGEEEIAASLRTLTVTPGLELLIPVGTGWLVKPYGEMGALRELDSSTSVWVVSGGCKAEGLWREPTRDLRAGAALQHTSTYDKGWDTIGSFTAFDLGGDITVPLWFDVQGERARGGGFIFVRHYFSRLEFSTPGGQTADVSDHIEAGFSFAFPRRPRLLGIQIAKWYGLGVRFGENSRGIRLYLGFPF
jgi:hypothetical protein